MPPIGFSDEQKPSRSAKSPYSGTFKGSSGSDSESPHDDSSAASAKRGSSRKLRAQRTDGR
eukprot:7069460-Prymnesium_polylepis.1